MRTIFTIEPEREHRPSVSTDTQLNDRNDGWNDGIAVLIYRY